MLTWLMICVLLIALSLLCVSLANFTLRVKDNISQRSTVSPKERYTVSSKDSPITHGLTDNVLS